MIHVAGDEHAAAIAVRDYGVGLAPGESAMVFNRFWRADPARARTSGGTGLGLSISLEDTHLHGGWLQAWGRPGRGRAVPAHAAAPGRRAAAPEPAAAGARRRRGAGLVSAPPRMRLAGLAVAGGLAPGRARRLRPDARERTGRRDPAPAATVNDEPGHLHRPQAAAARATPPPDIVKGFLDAMTATPIQTNVAKQFLTSDAQASWNPERADDHLRRRLAAAAAARGVSVTLTDADQLDARGAWRGRLPRAEPSSSSR